MSKCRWVFLALSTLVVGGCASKPPAVSIQSVSSLPERTAPAPNGWRPGEVIVASRDLGSVLGTLGPSRRGSTVDGMIYTIYKDGSASVRESADVLSKGWEISCRRDKMTDAQNCTVSGTETGLMVILAGSSEPSSVCAIHHDFPGRTAAFRIDKDKPVQTNADGCVPGPFVNSLVKGRDVTVRSVKWPYDYPRDETGSLRGFSSAIELAKFIFSKIDTLTFPEV